MKPRLIYLIIISFLLSSLFAFPPGRTEGIAQTLPGWEGQIAYLGSDGNIWVQRGDNPRPIQVTADASDQRRYLSPRFSPGGDLLAYCQNDQGGVSGSQIILMRTGAWQPIALVDDVACQGFPQRPFDWSPDGTHIAYTHSFESGQQANGSQWSKYHGIWSVDVISGEAEEIVSPPGTNPLVYPLWSPDGRWIRMYELVFDEGLGVLRTWNMDNGALYNWVGVGGEVFPGSADWSPDSSRLVFDQVTYVGYPGAGLYTAAPDVTGLQQIYADPGRGAVQPLWSPDGVTLSFQLLIYYENEQASMMISSPDGSGLDEAFEIQASMVSLDWSPAGDQLLLATNDLGQTGLYIYDLRSKTGIPVVETSGWQADWAPLPEGVELASSENLIKIEGFEASGGSLLVYLAEDFQIQIFDPANGSQAVLSPPLSAVSFWTSPSGERLVYGDRMLTLNFLPSGSLMVGQTVLPNIPVGEEIRWAPDESRMAFQDAQGHVWMVEADGGFVEIPGASGLPDWSSDGRFLSYCTEGEILWVVGGGISLREVASPVDCDAQWSPSQPLLAYTEPGSAEGDVDQVHIYDAERGKSSLALDSTTLVGWSPDGEILAMKREGKFGGRDFTFYVTDPVRDKLLEVGQHKTTDPGLQDWGQTLEEYILGPYQISADLTSSDRISPVVYDVSGSGEVLLIGNQTDSTHELVCVDMAGGQPSTLVEANLRGVPAARKPGIWAQLSSDGSWTSSYHYDSGAFQYMLTRCDRQRQANMETSEEPSGDSFSGDALWYVQQLPGENRVGQTFLYDLQTLDRVSFPSLSGAPAAWVTPPEGVIANSFSLMGHVSGEDGEPEAAVNILVDGEPAATSDQDGKFELSELSAGEYDVTALKGDLVFTPQSHTIDLPDDTGDIVFTVQSVPQQEESFKVDEEQVTQPAVVTETGVDHDEAETTPDADTSGAITTGNIWLYGLGVLLVIFLLVVLVFRLIRRRRKTPQPTAGAPAEEDVPPTSKAAPDQVSSQLQNGVDLIKAGHNSEGLQVLEDVLEEDPDNALAWLWSGMAATKMEDWSTAERNFNRAKKLDHPKADEALKWLEEQRAK